MITRSAPLIRRAGWLAACVLVLSACAASNASTWTYVPAAGTPAGSAAPTSSAPSASNVPAESAAPGSPAASGGQSGASFDLVETASLSITDTGGAQVTTLSVKKGQTYHFRITNSAGFPHNYYVGKVSDLEASAVANLMGTGDFSSGSKEFDYTFSDDSAPLGFGCLIPGHYQAGMKGTFAVQP